MFEIKEQVDRSLHISKQTSAAAYQGEGKCISLQRFCICCMLSFVSLYTTAGSIGLCFTGLFLRSEKLCSVFQMFSFGMQGRTFGNCCGGYEIVLCKVYSCNISCYFTLLKNFAVCHLQSMGYFSEKMCDYAPELA